MPFFRTISIRRAAVAALAGAMILSLIPATTMVAASPHATAVRQAEWSVLGEINRYRASRGLAPVRMAQQARIAARYRSRDMSDNRYLSHSSPTGRDAASLLRKRNVSYMAGAENIGSITFMGWERSVQGIMSGWKNSTSHRQSILSNNFNYVGIGVARTANVAYFTTIFLLQKDHTAPKAGMVAAGTGLSVASGQRNARRVTVRWWGQDRRLQRYTAGLRTFIVQHKKAGGKWRTVRRNTLRRSLTMNLSEGKHRFRVRAVDKRGNAGAWRRPLDVTVH